MSSPAAPRDKDRHRTSSRDRNRSREHHRSSHKESRRRPSRSTTPPRTTGRSHRSSNRSRSRSTGRDREIPSKRTRRSRSRSTGRRRGESRDRDREVTRRNRAPLPSQQSSWAVTTGQEEPVEVEKPNYFPTGLLAAESNSVKQADGSVIRLKYSEPSEACKPTGRDADRWKLFVFRDGESEDTVPLGIRSSWLFGREKKVVDYPVRSGSVSGQHAVLQFRERQGKDEFGERWKKVGLYVIDLDSGNGTVLNGEKIPKSCYVEVRNKDVLRFGKSETDYVVVYG